MKTLHKLFHSNLISIWLKLFLASLFGFVLLRISNSHEESWHYKKLFSFLSFLLFLLPLFTIFHDTKFIVNIKLLINQHFNRYELIKFYFLSTTLKYSLIVISYIVIFLGFEYMFPETAEEVVYKVGIITYYELIVFGLLCLGVFYITYIVGLFKANLGEVQREQIIKQNKKTKLKDMKFLLGCLALMFLGIIGTLDESFSIPPVLISIGITFFIISTALFIFNRAFKLYHVKEVRKYIYGIAMGGCIPLVFGIFLVINETHNPNITYNERVDSVLFLTFLNDYSKEEMVGFLSEAKKGSDHNGLLGIFKNKLNLEESLKTIRVEDQAISFLGFHSNKKSFKDVLAIVDFMEFFKISKKPTKKFNQRLSQFYSKQRLSSIEISKFMTPGNSFRQIAGVIIAYRSLKYKQFIEFIIQNQDKFEENVANHKLVKRAIASSKEKTE